MAHVTGWSVGRCGGAARSARGFTLIELLVVVALVGVLAGVAVAITPGIIRVAKGEGTTTQVTTFLIRARELAISKRRNVEIRFTEPDRLIAVEMPVPGLEPEEGEPVVEVAPDIVAADIRFEGGLEYFQFDEIDEDTPDAFGMAAAINLGTLAEDAPVMFTSEGSFTDINGDPINASIFLGVKDQLSTAAAITIVGATATVHQWRWNGNAWTDY
jgi:prepilin-type N-terminal cleavage/methylation domain-containing protein